MQKYLIFALLFFGAPAFAEELSADQIEQQLIGQSISWWDANGWMTGSLILSADGKAEIFVKGPRQAHDAGQWTFQGNLICTVWSSMRGGLSKCYSVREVGSGHFMTSGGNEFQIVSAGV